MNFPIIAVTVFILLVVCAVIAFVAIKEKRKEFKRTGKYPEGHYIGLGLALGMAIGMPLGLAMDNIALGPGMGLPIGLAIGVALEKKHKAELRPLTENEKKAKRIAALGGIIALVIGVGVVLVMIFLK
jgi:preprotein translocase subunit YajC